MDLENPQDETLEKTSATKDLKTQPLCNILLERMTAVVVIGSVTCFIFAIFALVVYLLSPPSPNTCDKGDLDCLLWRTYMFPNVCYNGTLYTVAVQDGYKHYFAVGKCTRP